MNKTQLARAFVRASRPLVQRYHDGLSADYALGAGSDLHYDVEACHHEGLFRGLGRLCGRFVVAPADMVEALDGFAARCRCPFTAMPEAAGLSALLSETLPRTNHFR